jgi:hypothetical protein
LVYFMALWYICFSFSIFPRFGILYIEKSGNPDANATQITRFFFPEFRGICFLPLSSEQDRSCTKLSHSQVACARSDLSVVLYM